jgi:type I restriction enzyme S subunit
MEQIDFNAPKGWSWKNFVDVCVLKRGYDLPTHARSAGDFPLYSANGVTDHIDQFKVDGPGVVTGRSGTIGKVHFVEGDYWPLNTALYVQKFNGNSPRFIKYFLENFDLTRFASGAAVPTLNRNSLSAELVCVPDSAEEQKRIVEKLDALISRIDSAIEHLQESVTLADALFKSTLSSLVCNESTDHEKLSLEELGSFSGGGTPSKSKSEFWNGEILWVTPKDMKSPIITDSKLKITSEGVSGSSAKFIPARSILIVARSGILQHTLPVCINDIECTVNQDIKVFIPSDRVCSEYVQYMLKGHESFILSELVKGGVTVESLKYKEFQNFKFSVPSIKVQQEIIKKLTYVSRLTDPITTELNEKISHLKKLKSSILDSAFKGEL